MSTDSFTTLHALCDLGRSGDVYTTHIPEDWLQGRTAFGGLTAALCLEAVLRDVPGLPPLRSAQISFIGPCAGDVTMTTTLLRQGRNVTFVRADLAGEKGIATSCTFAFGTTRESQFTIEDLPMPLVPEPDALDSMFPPSRRPSFAQHYDQRLASANRPVSGAEDPHLMIWVRHQEWQENTGIVPLLAIGDALPPALMPCFREPAPISSMTWMVNFLSDNPVTENGWWLMKAEADHTANGYSSQNMWAWNRQGEPVMTARQSVAIFA